jgi:hypothetical protein
MPLGLQAKLLRVLQEEEIRRVGDHKTRRVDVRLLAATAAHAASTAGPGRAPASSRRLPSVTKSNNADAREEEFGGDFWLVESILNPSCIFPLRP